MNNDTPRLWINDESAEPLTALVNAMLAEPREAPWTCPVCGEPEAVHVHLHRFAGSFGGAWIWCSACRRYDHDRRPLPAWWVNNSEIDLELLVSPPVPIDERSDVIDQHWNFTAGRLGDG